MDALSNLVVRAQARDLGAYSALVHRFQDMAVGYAFSILGDFHLAEDAAQEAFVRAYLDLGKLRNPEAFAGWFRRIVFTRCGRFTRRQWMAFVPLDPDWVSDAPGPDDAVEARELQDRVHYAIQSLPETEREVTTLYYIGGRAQKEIGRFLGIPAQTVKSRLHTARKRLRERMMAMVEKNLQDERPSNDPDFQVKVIQELEDITQLTDQEIQRMLRRVDTKDLAMAMVNASDKFRERINANISARVGKIIDDYIESQTPVAEDRVARNRAIVVGIVQELIAEGEIVWPPPEAKPEHKPLPQDYLDMKARLKKQLREVPVSHLDFEALTRTLVDLANVARYEGILKLEGVVKDADDPDGFLSLGMELIIDGVAPKLVEEMMTSRKRVLLHQYGSKLDMMMTAIRATQLGENPRVIEQKLQAMY